MTEPNQGLVRRCPFEWFYPREAIILQAHWQKTRGGAKVARTRRRRAAARKAVATRWARLGKTN